MSLAQDNGGQSTARKVLALVIAISVFGIIAAVGLPVAIDAIEGDTTTTLTQDVSTEYEVNAELNSTVTAATAGTPDSATVELNDTRTSGTTSNSVDNGSTTDYDMDGGTVTVGVENVEGGSSATVNYTYANDYPYSGGASALWGIIGLAIVLSAVLYILVVGLDAAGRL